MDITIRRGIISDSELLSKLSEQTFRDAFGHTCTESDMNSFVKQYFSKQVISQELEDTADYYFLAYLGEAAVGYMRLKEDYSDYENIRAFKALELKRIYVLNSFQGKAIGKQLLSYAEQFAIDNSFEVLWLGVWEHNEGAKKLYKQMGFEDTGDNHHFYIGENESTDNWFVKRLR